MASCGEYSSGPSAPVPLENSNRTVSVTVSGLSGSGLVLQDNGSGDLSISADGTFRFSNPVAGGSPYAVTVLTQPGGQRCSASDGSGIAGAVNISVAIDCVLVKAWTWTGGSSGGNAFGVYGTQGVAAAGNVPGARENANSWFDSTGTLWYFGGYGYGASGATGTLNDLWRYSAGQWTWVSGSSAINASGVYGTEGTAAASNVPGARAYAVSWFDVSGRLWLFGGIGYDPAGYSDLLNDLWEYSAGQWTWVSGANAADSIGIYGTQGVPAPGNVPGGRSLPVTWIDSSGNLWLLGGSVVDSAGQAGFLNDLWEFRAGEWTWVSGSTTQGANGSYGTRGTAASGNVPGGRFSAVSWIDPSGKLWLFGGYGIDSAGTASMLNDLWMYSAGRWTWVSGSSTANASGSYGVQGVAAASNVPGARYGAASWIDPSGKLWLFGGYGFDSAGIASFLNDLWEFNAGQWTWVGGSSTADATGSYGTEGSTAAGNVPGALTDASSFIDSSGNLWLIGGFGFDSAGSVTFVNGIWEYTP
jgi:N-acetylneuraminic acid mutarotase